MKEATAKNYPVIDIMKLFFALCIVAVHVWFLYDTRIGYYLYTMLYRLGVPFFFLASGYFLANNVIGEERESKFSKILKKTLVRYLLLAMLCVIINLIKENDFSIYTLLQLSYKVLIGDSLGIAWFLGALFVSYLIIYFLKEKKQVRTSLIVALFLYIVGLFCTTYVFLIKDSGFSQIYTFFIDKFGDNSNWLFEGFLFVCLGYYIRAYSDKIKSLPISYFYILSILGVFLLFLEVRFIRPHLDELVNYEYYFSHLILIPSIFMIGIKTKLNDIIKFSTSIIRKLSIYFFYFHPTVLELLLLYMNYSGNKFLSNNIGFYFSICIITLIISLILLKYSKLSKLKDNKRMVAFGIYLISTLIIIFSFFTLFNSVIWGDEACSLAMLKHNLIDIIKLNINDVHPPLYYLSLKLFYSISNILHIGIDVITLSKFFSFIHLITLYIFSLTKVRKKYGEIASSLFCLLIAGMPHLMEYFVEIRMYSWALCFTTIAFIYFTDILDSKNPSNKMWIKFVTFSLLSAYSHIYSCMCVVLLYAYLFFYYIIKKDKALFKKWLLHSAITILIYLPCIIIIFKQFLDVSGDYWIPPITMDDIKHYFEFILKSSSFDSLFSRLSFIFVVFTILYLLIRYIIDKKNSIDRKYYITYGISIPFIVMAIGVIVSIIVNPIFISRYLVPSLGCIWFSVALLISNYYEKSKYAVAFIFIFALLSCSNINSLIRNEISLSENKISFEQYMDKISSDDIVIADYQHVQLVISHFQKDNIIYCYECYNKAMINDLFINIKDNITMDDIIQYKKQNKKIYLFACIEGEEFSDLFKQHGLIVKDKSQKISEDWYTFVVYEL